MKKILQTIALLALLLTCGCTQYNGYIGPIFGSWALDSITEDGRALQQDYETIFSFQNEIVRVVRLDDPPYSSISRYGNFKLSDDVLTLKFSLNPSDTEGPRYLMPDWLYFPQDVSPLVFDVRKLAGSSMVLELHAEGKTYVYTFRKTW